MNAVVGGDVHSGGLGSLSNDIASLHPSSGCLARAWALTLTTEPPIQRACDIKIITRVQHLYLGSALDSFTNAMNVRLESFYSACWTRCGTSHGK